MAVFNSEIQGNFLLKKKKKVFGKYFQLITMAEHHEHFEELIADFHMIVLQKIL